MGSIFCCPRVPVGASDQAVVASEGCYLCLLWPIQQLLDTISLLQQRRQGRIAPEQASPAFDSQSADHPSIDTFHAPPPPLPFDDPRFSHFQHQRSCSGKASALCDEACATTKEKSSDIELVGSVDKWKGWSKKRQVGLVTNCDVDFPVSSEDEDDASVGSSHTSEDEDVCPICLEEYTSENPSSSLQCKHNFHLGCVYEWMERSEACPVCSAVMLFDEEE